MDNTSATIDVFNSIEFDTRLQEVIDTFNKSKTPGVRYKRHPFDMLIDCKVFNVADIKSIFTCLAKGEKVLLPANVRKVVDGLVISAFDYANKAIIAKNEIEAKKPKPVKAKKLSIKYGIFDGRYITDPDSAICHEMCDTKKEANKQKSDYGDDCVVVKMVSERINSKSWLLISSEIV